MDTLFTHFYTWKSHFTYGKPCPHVENGLIRSKNSTKYVNLGFHNSFSKLRYIWWNTGTSGNVFVHFHLWKPPTDHKPIPYMEKWYFCDHQTAFQSFPLNLTMATNFLCPLQWHKQSVDWLYLDGFPPMENSPSTDHKPVPHKSICMTVLNLLSIYFTIEIL